MKYDLIIFDLDGTTLSTLEDLANACNAALKENGCPERSLREVRAFVGSGVANLMRRAIPEGSDDALWQKTLADFKRIYAANVSAKTAPYPGILDLLAHLRAAGLKLAVNSNKLDSAVQSLCKTHFPNLLDMALGERDGIEKKPSPDGAKFIMSTLNCSASRTLYVGDSDIDLLTAQNAGLDCAWVSWGFRGRDELGGLPVPHAFDSVSALEEFILD